MSQIAATQIAKPRDEQAFERASLVLFRELLGDPNIKTNGRRGQRQNGVDIFGFRNQDAMRPVGIQCKLKGEGKALSEEEVRAEVEKALAFSPPLREYIIITTAPDDGEIDRLARELTVEIASVGRQIAINVWGWTTLEQRISENGSAMQAFDPSYGPFAQKQINELQRLGEQQTVAIREITNIRQEIGSVLSGNSLPGDSTVAKNALEAALDEEVDRYRDLLNAGKPKTALGLYEALLNKVSSTASGRILFRIKANIGHCHLVTDDYPRAAHWLFESFANAPNEPKAIANYALALLLSNRYREAYDYGVDELRKDPSNQSLAPMVVQAAARCPEIDDPLSEIPDPLRQLQDVQTANVDALRLRNKTPDWWIAARAASNAHPDHKLLLQYRAEADLDEIGNDDEFQRTRQINPDALERIAKAANILSERWNERRVSEYPARPDGVAACCNLLTAYQALGRTAEALAIAKQATSLVPNDKPLNERAAIAALDANDLDFAEQLIANLPDTANATLIRFQFYAHTANWSRLIEVARDTEKVPEHERASMRTMALLSELMVANPSQDKKREALSNILEVGRNDIRSCVIVADFADRLGVKEVGDSAYERAIALIENAENLLGRQMLARTAGRRNDWAVVTRLLDGYVSVKNDSPDLSLLVTAFANENPTRKRALDFFNELDSSVRNQPYNLVAYGHLQSKRGDLVDAAGAFEKALTAQPQNLTALENLYAVYVRQERADREDLINDRINALDFEKLKGTPRQKMVLAHIMRDSGQGQKALKWAYRVIGENPNDSDVALGYFGLLIARGDRIVITQPTEVSVDTWFSAENNLGEKINIVIEAGTDRPGDGVYTPSHPFVAPALGLKVGETFARNQPFGAPETWTVTEIKNKYLSKLHEVMETFNVRFPEAEGLYRITTREGDLAPILDEIKLHSEKTQNIFDFYIEKKFPLSLLAAITGTYTLKFALSIAQSGHDIVACTGIVSERLAAERLARDYASKGAVLDCLTAWSAAVIGVLPALRSLFGQISIPRSAIDELASIQHELRDHPGPVMTIGYRDGQYFKEESTPEQIEERANAFAARRREIEAYCEIVPVDIPDDASELARSLLAEAGRSHILDAAILAAESDLLLVSDDLYFRQVAQQTCDAKGIFLQAAINIAAEKLLLTDAEIVKGIVGLASLRHSHVALTPPVLLLVAKNDQTEHLIEFRAVTEFIGTKNAEINSHVHITALFLRQVWSLDIPEIRRKACSGIILEQLLRFRRIDQVNILSSLRAELSGRARLYLDDWIKGHLLSQGGQ